METRKLHDTQELIDMGWRVATHEALAWGWDMTEEAKEYGRQLADHIVKGELSVQELLLGLRWASAHFREADSVLGIDWSGACLDDYEEAMTRQLALRAGLKAQLLICKSGGVEACRADYERRCRLLTSEANFGLGRLEARDLGLGSSLVKIVRSTLE